MAKNKKNKIRKKIQTESSVVKEPAKKSSDITSHTYLFIFACLIITLICYLPAFSNGWTNWDDEGYVLNNSMTRNLSLSKLPEFFSTFQMGNYHPFPMLSLALDYTLFGTEAGGFHFHSILLHFVNVALVYAFVWLLTKKFWAAFITALFFGIHPAHIESVSWVSERKDLLYVLYYMAALIAYLKYSHSEKKGLFYILSIFLFVFSLLSKGQAVTLPIVMLFIDYYLRRPLTVKTWVEKIPFFLLSICFGIVAIIAQQHAKAISVIPYYSIFDRFVFSAYSMVTYFYKSLLPISLSSYYPYPRITDGHYSWVICMGTVLALLLFSAIIYSSKFGRTIIFGFAFFLVNIGLILQILPVGGAMMADRYTYLSYIGLFFIMGMGVQYVAEDTAKLVPQWKYLVTTIVLGCTVFFSISTYFRNHIWENSETLYLDMLDHYSYIPVANNNLGNYYNKQAKLDLAYQYFLEAVRLQPEYEDALINLSDIYRQRGRIDSSIVACNQVLRLDKNNQSAYMNRGIALSIAGRYDSALADFDIVLNQDKQNAKAYSNRGNLYDMKGLFDSAISDYNKALLYDSAMTEVYGNRGRSNLHRKLYAEAIKDLTLAIQYQQGNPQNYALRSDANFGAGNYQQALDDALTARNMGMSINPAFIDTLKARIGKK